MSVIPLGSRCSRSISSIFVGDRLGGRQRLFVLAHEDDALDDVVFGPAADDPKPGLVSDHDLGDLADEDRRAVIRCIDDDLANVVQLRGLDLGGAGDLGRIEWVDPFAQEPDGADIVRLGAQGKDVTPDVGVGFLDRVFDLLHRHAVLFHQPGVDQNLILLDGPTVAGHIDHTGHLLEGAVRAPSLARP